MRIALALTAVITLGICAQGAYAQDFGGGVDKDGSWYAGEGLEPGDYYRYHMCHLAHNGCADFVMEFWLEGEVRVGTESQWMVQAVVHDGRKVIKGTMTLGKIAPEPTGGTLPKTYSDAFKSSIVWLSSFATSHDDGGSTKGPKEFRAISWGKIANIGGEQVKPLALDTVSTRAGQFDAVIIGWKTGGVTSRIWVVDDFPFPVRASTWAHVSEGEPPQEYRFELLEHKKAVLSNPFADVVGTDVNKRTDCPKNYDLVKVYRPTDDFEYLVNLKYGPENPEPGCDIELLISFHKKTDETEYLTNVQYDVLVLDERGVTRRSIAQDEGRQFLFSDSGQSRSFITIMEPPGKNTYALLIYGLGPKFTVPTGAPDTLQVEIDIAESTAPSKPQTVVPSKPIIPIQPAVPITPVQPAVLEIPEWVKSTAGYWVDDKIADSEFAGAIEFLIAQGIIIVPDANPGGTGAGGIPAWVKSTTGYWVQGQIADSEFAGAIEFLIAQGIIKI